MCIDFEEQDPATPEKYFVNIAWSATSDPFLAWHNERVQITNGVGNGIDQTNIAVSDTKIYINFLRSLNGQDINVLHIYDKATMLAGTLPTPTVLLNTPNIECPAKQLQADDGYPQYYVAAPHSTQTSCDSVVLHAVNELGAPTMVSSVLAIPAAFHYVKPPSPTEPAGPIGVGARAEFLRAVYKDGVVWAVHHTSTATIENQVERCVVQWERIAPNGWPYKGATPSIEVGRLDEGPGFHTYLPSVSSDSTGRIVVVYLRSGPLSPIQIRRVIWEPGQSGFGSPATVGAISVGKLGKNISAGHYSDIEPDRATPNSLWCHFELPSADLVATDYVRQFSVP